MKHLISCWDVSIVHCGRESNGCADWLAKRAVESNVDFTILQSPSMNMAYLVQGESSYSGAPDSTFI